MSELKIKNGKFKCGACGQKFEFQEEAKAVEHCDRCWFASPEVNKLFGEAER